MDTDAVKTRLADKFKGDLIEGEPLAGYTTFRIGGPADLLALPLGVKDLKRLLLAVAETECSLLVLGRGSNVLVSDGGFHGVVVVLSKGLCRTKKKGKYEVYVESGCDLNKLINWTIERGLSGLENLSGIPGSVGGAVRMNAGAMGSSISEHVEQISILRIEGGDVKERYIDAEDIGFSYRHSDLKSNDVIHEVKLKLSRERREVLEARRKEVNAWRKENQPLKQPSAGSIFRNPKGRAAGEIIEQSGLKGARIGEAMVSEKHANFIVNLGGAKASDVLRLIERIKEEVYAREGIELEEEIRLIGEMGERGQ
jgi:UDP-N-acetylmuramate dehydrogenase